jgi:Excalibur calcium-binding domain.
MKKLILIIALLTAWQYFHTNTASNSTTVNISPQSDSIEGQPSPLPTQSSAFKCDGRVYCSQMTSLEEAEFFIRNCPGTKMDGNNDGEPCERDSRFH